MTAHLQAVLGGHRPASAGDTRLAAVTGRGYARPVTIKEAAALLGLEPVTLRVQISKGKLKATKVGRDWHVTAREVERYRRTHLREDPPDS